MRLLRIIFITTCLVFIGITNVSAEAPSTDNKFFVSPTFQVLDYSDSTRNLETSIIVDNRYTHFLEVTLTPVLLTVNQGKITISIDESDALKSIKPATTNFKVSPNSSLSTKVTISSPQTFPTSTMAGVKVEGRIAGGTGEIETIPAVVTVFSIEKTDGLMDARLTLNISRINFLTPEFEVVGTIENTGQKTFYPSTLLQLFKQQTLLNTFEVTTQTFEPVIPGDSISFTKKVNIDFPDTFLESGAFDIVGIVKLKPSNTTITESVSVFHIDRNFLIIIITILIILSIVVIYLIIQILQRRKMVKKI